MMTVAGTMKLHLLRCGSILVAPGVATGGRAGVKEQAKYTLTPAGTRTELPVFCYLLEHPKGRILVDTGWSRAISPEGVYDAAAVRKVLPAHLAAFYHPVLPKGEAIEEQLAALGLCPADIDLLLLTHLDPDHVSGLAGLKGVKRVLLPEDEYFWSCRTVYKARQPRSLWIDTPMEHFWYRGTPLGPVKWSYDVFGDGSVIMINCPGHTDGMGVVRVENNGRFIILAADAAFSPANWETLTIPGYGFDEKRMLKSLQWLKEQAESPACAGIFCSHDPGMNSGIFEF